MSENNWNRDLARWQGVVSADMRNIKRSLDELRDSHRSMTGELRVLREEWAGAKGAGRLAGGMAGLFGAGALHLLMGWLKK